MPHTILVRLDVDEEYIGVDPQITAEDYLEGSKAHGWEVVTERTFTESEVKAMALQAIKLIQRDLPQSPEHVGRAGGAIAKALLDSGIVLDPA